MIEGVNQKGWEVKGGDIGDPKFFRTTLTRYLSYFDRNCLVQPSLAMKTFVIGASIILTAYSITWWNIKIDEDQWMSQSVKR